MSGSPVSSSVLSPLSTCGQPPRRIHLQVLALGDRHARLSVQAITQVALEATRRAARELLDQGTYGGMEAAVPFPEANGMFAEAAAVR